MTNRLWLIPLGGFLMAPLVTWLPMLALRFPGSAKQAGEITSLGLPLYEPAKGIDIWHQQAFWFVVFALVALLVGQRDRWLGCAVFTLGCGMLLWAGTFDVTHRIVFLGGALALWAMRQMPPEWSPMARAVIAASGVFQTAYVLQQYLGYDLLWGPLVGGQLKPQLQALGTLGTVDAASAYIAVTAPLMPWWALPVAIGVVLKSHSIGAIVALLVGLLVRYHRNWKLTAAIVAAILWVWYRYYMPPHVPSTVSGRLAIWKLGVADWWATNPLFGPAPWAQRIPMVQMQQNVRPNGEIWLEAHNEYLQWLYETGLVGVSILGLWLWEHRTMFRDAAVGASLCALAVVSGSFFTFHVVSVALLGLILVAMATSHPLDTPQEVA